MPISPTIKKAHEVIEKSLQGLPEGLMGRTILPFALIISLV